MIDDVIHAGVEETLTWLTTKDPGLKQLLEEAHGYAVFPSVGRASVVLGGARGHGEVFEEGKPIGFATLTQMTVGLQVGGQTFSELILFGDKDALEVFKNGMVRFTANASAVFVRGATGTTDSHAFVAKAYSRGGMLLEASLGGQKFTFHEHLPEKKGKRESQREIPGEGRDEAKLPSPPSEPQAALEREREEESASEVGTPYEAEAADADEEAPPNEGLESAEEGRRYDAEAGSPGSEEGLETAPEQGYEAEVAEEVPAPDEGFEAAPAEGAAYEAAEAAPAEGLVTGPERHEGNDAVPSEAEPGGGASTATEAAWRSRPQGPNGAAAEAAGAAGAGAGAVSKAGAGVKRRLAGTGRKLVGKVAHGVSKRAGPRGLNRVGVMLAARRYPTLVGKPLHLLDRIKDAATALDDEVTFGPVLSAQVDAALRRMTERDPGLNEMLDKGYGYAVFPLVGKAAAALGIGFGRGEVYEHGKLIGYARIVQLTLGVQVGGEAYDQLMVFENEGALERFKAGKLAFAANASAVIVKAGAAATTNYSSGTAVFVHPVGGLMIELGSGGQAFTFRRKVLGAPGVEASGVEAPKDVEASGVEAPKDVAPEVQPKASVADEAADEARPVQPEREASEVKGSASEATAEEPNGGATEVARNAGARAKASLAAARTKASLAAARTSAAAAVARTRATEAVARTRATAAASRTNVTVGDAGTAMKSGIGAFMRRPRSKT